MSMEYDAHGYEMAWRPNFELWAVYGWAVAGAAAVMVKMFGDLPAEPLYAMLTICLIMAAARAKDAIRLHRTHRNLRGKDLKIVELQEVVDQVEGRSDELWLGYGFDWEAKHAQRAFELSKRDWSEFSDGAGNKDMGVKWLHGLELNESAIFQPMKHVEGHTLITGTTGSGKAQPLDSLIHTPSGWKQMGDVKVGDRVSTPDGGSAIVNGVFPQGEKEIYEIEFSDGRKVKACGEHLWEVHHKHWRGKYKVGISRAGKAKSRILDTLSLKEQIESNKGDFKIRLAEPVEKPAQELPLHPYLMGCILGDGLIGKNNRMMFSSADAEIIDRVRRLLPPDTILVKKPGDNYDYIFKQSEETFSSGRLGEGQGSRNAVRKAVIELGLGETRSWEKHVPEIYKKGSISQRWALLQGLMDTDGYIGAKGDIQFGSCSQQLAMDVQEIVWSLGGIASITAKETKYRNKKGDECEGRVSFSVNIRHQDRAAFFQLSRKSERANKAYQYKEHLKLRVAGIRRVSKEPAQCISVDHPDHLYITDHYVVTHNTRLFDLLITQRILAGESVVVLDPKGDKELRENMKRACEFMGDPDKFISFHPGFPHESVRLDPLANFSRPTELASRIAALIATSSGGEVFKDFGQMAMNNIIQGLLLIDARPSLTRIRRYLEGGTESLVLQAVSNYIERAATDFQRDFSEVMTRVDDAPTFKKAAVAVRFYRDKVMQDKPNSDLEGLLTMFEHDKAHFSKMVASLLPIMNMLTSGDLGPMLSPERTDQDDPRPIYDTRKITERNKVAYVGLDSLTDAMVGSAIGSMFLSDLTAVAGDRYNYGSDLRPINIFVDECAEVINDPLIQLLNKGRGAKLRLFVATQTIADFQARLGDASKATQVLGNINNNISLRVLDPDTQSYITDNLRLTRVKYVMRTQGMSSDSSDPALFGGNHGERLMEEEAPLLQPQLLGYLPNLEFVAKISGSRVVKGRLPILVESKEQAA